nr:RNA-directed DNA polymerase, eukaryota, reverse transcriptase zinc-binding domain protein [Tanacetum cinerariifolium]
MALRIYGIHVRFMGKSLIPISLIEDRKQFERYKLHANVAKFQRDRVNKHSTPHNDTGIDRDNAGGNVGGVKGAANSYAYVLKGNYYLKEVIDSSPSLVLDDSCLNQKEYSVCLLGKVKDFASLSKLKVVLGTKKKFQSNLAMRTWFSQIIQASSDFNIDERVRAKEVLGWVPNFVDDIEEENDLDDDSYKGEIKNDGLKFSAASDVEPVPESKFEEDLKKHTGDDVAVGQNNVHEDPFDIYDIINKKRDTNKKDANTEDSLKFPHGFTPRDDEVGASVKNQRISNNKCVNDVEESIGSGHFSKSEVPRTGGLIIQLMDDLVNVGQTMGYDMTGCLAQKAKKDWVTELCVSNKVNFLSLQETKMEKIELFNIKRCWGKFSFEYVYSEAVGNSGGILCVCDPNMFKKINDNVSDYFTMVRRIWVPNGKMLLIISVYAPQELSEKRRLWDNLSLVISNWEGEVVIMRDFNKVRDKRARFESVFNRQDHRPILMREVKYDYGPVPFRFFHYWFEVDDFDKLVEDTWKESQIIESNAFLKMLKKLRHLKVKIQMWSILNKERSNSRKRKLKAELADLDLAIDKGDGEVIDVNRRHEVVRLLQDVEKTESLEVAQKAKIKWAIEESILIKKMIWNERLTKRRLKGRCGIDKAPGPDGFTFGFYRRYWNLIESDVVDAISCFFQQGVISKGGNSSFITLIPKVPNANMVKDFRPISLIGSLYKFIANILANRLVMVLGTLVNDTQSAFVADRQILDEPFILNELVQWCKKKKKKQAMIFKVDFKKDFDSDVILRKFGFGEKWCNWIQSCLRSSRGSVIVNGSPTKEFQFYKGLKQGDPLSSFLFILVMESLHVSFQRVVDADISKVKHAAAKIGRVTLKILFNYLGSKVGGLMSRQSWNEIVESLATRLSRWKLKTLSIGGRLTLLKSVLGAIPIYHMSIFKVPMKVLQRMESIRSRFFNGVDIHSKKTSWVRWKNVMASKDKGGIDLLSFIHSKLGNGENTSFWEVHGDSAFKDLFPRMYALESLKSINVASKLSHCGLAFSLRRNPKGEAEQAQFDLLKEKVEGCILVDMFDRWVLSLEGSGDFTVSSVSKLIDDVLLSEVSTKTRWIKAVPIKVNVHAWKVKIDCLPTRFNISHRGMDIESILCPICGGFV